MSICSLRTRFDLARQESGFAMVLVIGFSAVIASLVLVGTAIGVNTLQSSRQHVSFEGALSVAEGGIDNTLSIINTAYNGTPSYEYVTTGACALTAPTAIFTSDKQERTWALGALKALPASCTATVTGGQYVAVRPTNRRAVYSLAWSPRRTAPNVKSRLIKAEYLFAPYKPSNAVLTQGTLDFSGSVAIDTLSSTPSDVHSNQNVSGYNGSTHIAGTLSASGTTSGSCPAGITGGCKAGDALQVLPNVSARKYWDDKSLEYAANWYDLCPDGTMRSQTIAATGLKPTIPCGGDVLPTTNGWEYAAGSGTTAPSWTIPAKAGGPFNGVYYVYHGDAIIGGNGNSKETWQISVLAEAGSPTSTPALTGPVSACSKYGGNVSWKLFNLTPWLSGLQMLADTNLTGDANASAGSGLFLAGHKIDLQTSSSVLTGAVIAANSCSAAGGNTIQGVTVHYDDTLEAPLSDLIRTSLWLDYATG